MLNIAKNIYNVSVEMKCSGKYSLRKESIPFGTVPCVLLTRGGVLGWGASLARRRCLASRLVYSTVQ